MVQLGMGCAARKARRWKNEGVGAQIGFTWDPKVRFFRQPLAASKA
jgi:hypothetical protein